METEQVQTQPTKEPLNTTKKLAIILSIIGYALTIGIALYLFQANQVTSKQLTELTEANKQLQSNLEQVKGTLSSYEHERKLNFLNRFAHYVEGGVVTDELVLNKLEINAESPDGYRD